MENKYYVPEIDEFCIGLEYEFRQNESCPWIKITIGLNDVLNGIPELTVYGLYEYNFRVKYLDKDDIESFGFKQFHHIYCNYQYNKEDFDKYGNRVFYEIQYSNDRDKLYIKEDDNGRLFNGIIKNKSELKRLLKQLEII